MRGAFYFIVKQAVSTAKKIALHLYTLAMKTHFVACLTLLLLLLVLPAFAQVTGPENDTIQMKEVEIVKKGKKLKLKTRELDGPCYYAENMQNAEEIITLVSDLPGGLLESVTFYFNDVYTSRKQTEKFKDTEFELVLYNTKPDGTPGDPIAHDPLTIKVSRTFSGRLTADLSMLAVETPEKLFIGLRRKTVPVDKDEFFIDCICSGIEYVTMVRKNAASPWERRWQCAALRAEVNVAVQR